MYLFRFKLSNDAFAAYVNEPSHLEPAALKLIEAAGGKLHNYYYSVSTAETIAITEIDAESMAAVEMVTMSSGVFTSVEGIEIIDSKSMTAAMETANKVVSAYQAPNK